MKFSKKLAIVFLSLLLIFSVIKLAEVSATIQIAGQNSSSNVIDIRSPKPLDISGANLTSNVTSVSSGDAYIVIPQTTGNVITTLNSAQLNTTIGQLAPNHTAIVLNHNQTFNGNVHMRTGVGQTGLSLEDSNGNPYWTFVRTIFGLFNASLCTAPCAFGSSGFTEAFTFNGAGVIGYLGDLQGTSATITSVTSTNTISTNVISTNIQSQSVNTTYINTTEINTGVLNVTKNATIPHFNINKSVAFGTNYTNSFAKAIRLDFSIVSATSTLTTDTAEVKIVLNRYDTLNPQNVILCGTRSANRLGQSTDFHCIADIPFDYNYSIYSVVANGGTVALGEAHLVDE